MTCILFLFFLILNDIATVALPSIWWILCFQKFWHVVWQDVIATPLDCLHSKTMAFNFTHIVLISKATFLECLTQFRPISFCNILYKIVASVANRFKNIPYLISDSQSTFILRLFIINNVLFIRCKALI